MLREKLAKAADMLDAFVSANPKAPEAARSRVSSSAPAKTAEPAPVRTAHRVPRASSSS